MNNKVLIKLIVPDLNETYDVFIPVNEIVWKEIKLLAKAISDLSGGSFDPKGEYLLINLSTGKEYKNDDIIIDTEIRNSTELILISCNKETTPNNIIKPVQNINESQNANINNK